MKLCLTENFITLVNLIKICSECCTKLPTFHIIDYYKMLSFYNFINASALMNTRFVYLFLRILVMLLQMMKLPLLLLRTIVHVFCKKVRYHSKSCAFWHKFVLFIYMWTIIIFANITRDSITCFLYQ